MEKMMSNEISTKAALTRMTDRVIVQQDELANLQLAYRAARNQAAQSRLDMQAMQRGMNRKNAKLKKLEAFMDSHQQTSIYQIEQAEARRIAAQEWFKAHPEDKPAGWDEKHDGKHTLSEYVLPSAREYDASKSNEKKSTHKG